MSGLSERDMEVLRTYADEGNRLRYWNYLAHVDGNDGYGALALGVVRNDNMPGAVANAYAQSSALTHDTISLSEKGWEELGRKLVQEDFAKRASHFDKEEPALALNLPARDVQDAHRSAFGYKHISLNAWTPNVLIESARASAGEMEAEKVWHTMLDSRNLGVSRLAETSFAILSKYSDHVPDTAQYMRDLAKAEVSALSSEANTDPDHIRRGIEHYEYNAPSKSWTSYLDSDVAEFGFRTPSEVVKDPAVISDLDSSRAVRLERKAMVEQVHPDDPYHEIAKSPRSIAEAHPKAQAEVQLASAARVIDPDLYDDIRSRLPENTSPERLAQVTLATRQADMRGGDILGVSLLCEQTLLVQGRHPGDRAAIDLSVPPPSIEQTLSNHHAHEAQQAQNWTQFQSQSQQIEFHAQQQAQTQMQQSQAQSGPTMSGPGMG